MRQGPCPLLRRSRNVNRVAGDEEIPPAELSARASDFTGVNANAHAQACRLRVLCLPSLIEPGKRCLHIQRCSDCPVWIILVRKGRAENCHYRVTDVFLYSPPVPPSLTIHQVNIPYPA